MDNFKPENYGERWIKYIVQQDWGKHWHFICLAFAVFFGYFAIQDIKSPATTSAVMFLFLAIIYFERWHFSNILRKQQAQIDNLKAELKTTLPSNKAGSLH
jgi:hypothetical protein